MVWGNRDKTAIVGVGATDYYRRGLSWPRTINEMAGEAWVRYQAANQQAAIQSSQVT